MLHLLLDLVATELFKLDLCHISIVYFTSWLHMTFDLGMWHLTSLTKKGTHFAFVNRVWSKDIVGGLKRFGQMKKMCIISLKQRQRDTRGLQP